MGLKIFQVDAFTDRPFSGNPAAVCLLNGSKDDDWMQKVAAEMNLAETAFLYPEENRYRLRWFTPTKEIELCGHATLATAHILWQDGYTKEETIEFDTLSGLLTARRQGDWIELNFPVKTVEQSPVPLGFLEELSEKVVFAGKTRTEYLIELENANYIYDFKPNFAQINQLPHGRLIITAKDDQYDFVSRFFAPGVGIDEDPVTGSAHCALAYYWSNKLNKKEFIAYQVSKRGGLIKVRLDGDRVHLIGQAVTILRGELV